MGCIAHWVPKMDLCEHPSSTLCRLIFEQDISQVYAVPVFCAIVLGVIGSLEGEQCYSRILWIWTLRPRVGFYSYDDNMVLEKTDLYQEQFSSLLPKIALVAVATCKSESRIDCSKLWQRHRCRSSLSIHWLHFCGFDLASKPQFSHLIEQLWQGLHIFCHWWIG